ncbi:MAG TPA: beta-galactosidase [Natronosporangium sp.]
MAGSQPTGDIPRTASPLVPRVAGLCFGGDYNPEQWPEQTWREDAQLMREAGVTLVTVGVFSWSMLEPAPGKYEFGWLDRVLEILHDAGVAVDLATATASPPPWFSVAHPEALPVDAHGNRLSHGSRQTFCPSAPAYREAALALVSRLADRYADHPALAMWHVHNEYGCHNARCYCDTTAAAFRDWLRARYHDLDTLNDRWGTAFWSQRFTDWQQIVPPRTTGSYPNPGLTLDFHRFSSDALRALFVAERDLLHARTPGIPVTTNLISNGFTQLDYWQWAEELTGPDRLVSADHYLIGEDPTPPGAQIAYAADTARSLAGGGSWLLMEHSTSAVNWQPRNFVKPPGQLIRDSLAHVARGSEGAMFFQWRASRAGAERWHSAMVPHAGTDTAVWREVVTLGGHLRRLGEIAGSVVDAEVAVLLDYPSGWAAEGPAQPSVDMVSFDEVCRWHAALWRRGVTANLAHPSHDLSRYRLVLAPALYLLDDPAVANLAAYVRAGGTLLVGPYSGVVDEFDRVRLGGYPGALRELLGVRVEQYCPLPAGTTVALDNGATGRVWAEQATTTGADVVASYVDGPPAGRPALTRHPVGDGTAWYLGTRLTRPGLDRLLGSLGAHPLVPGLDAVRRRHPDGRSYLFLLNHGSTEVTAEAAGTDLLTGAEHAGPVTVPAGGVMVLRERL